MDYIEKLFKKHPFIYYIKGKYYAFGTLTCAECDGKSLLLEHRYKDFEENLKSDLTDVEAWEIFHKLSFEASIYRKKDGECVKIKEEFLKFGFDEDDIEELKSQMERCVEFFKKYELNQFTGLI